MKIRGPNRRGLRHALLYYTGAGFLGTDLYGGQIPSVLQDRKNYKEETQAVVKQIRDHEPANRKEPPAPDVLLSYEIAGEERSSEVVVPREQAAQYQVGSKVGIRYYVEENGAVHIATAGDAPRKIMYAYLAAIILEIVIYAAIWRILL